MDNLLNQETASAVASFGTSKIKEVFANWKNERVKSTKSWSTFCDKTKFGMPRVTDILPRLKSNVLYFQTNYIIVFFVLAIYSILTNPLFLFAILFCGSLWIYFLKWRTEPMKLGSREITYNHKVIALGIVTLVLFYLASVGNTVFWLLGATLTVVFLHALFFVPVEESDFDFNTTFQPTQQV